MERYIAVGKVVLFGAFVMLITSVWNPTDWYLFSHSMDLLPEPYLRIVVNIFVQLGYGIILFCLLLYLNRNANTSIFERYGVGISRLRIRQAGTGIALGAAVVVLWFLIRISIKMVAGDPLYWDVLVPSDILVVFLHIIRSVLAAALAVVAALTYIPDVLRVQYSYRTTVIICAILALINTGIIVIASKCGGSGAGYSSFEILRSLFATLMLVSMLLDTKSIWLCVGYLFAERLVPGSLRNFFTTSDFSAGKDFALSVQNAATQRSISEGIFALLTLFALLYWLKNRKNLMRKWKT